jgi:pimeloyl-ACP methyl ester carboxylesterase
MASAPIVLVPGFWLGAWAWDDVADALRGTGTTSPRSRFPGSSRPTPTGQTSRSPTTSTRSSRPVRAKGTPVVLAVHSGSGAAGYAVTDRIPDKIAAMVYVDSGPATAALGPDTEGGRHADGLGGDRVGREPRRSQRRAARDVQTARRPAARRRAARGAEAHQRRASRRADHRDRNRVHVRPVQGGDRRGPDVAGRLRRTPRRHLGRSFRRATGRCGRARRSSRRSSATSRAAQRLAELETERSQPARRSLRRCGARHERGRCGSP